MNLERIIKYSKEVKRIGVLQIEVLLLVINYISIVQAGSYQCGESPLAVPETIREGKVDVEAYPWMGLLIYPFGAGVTEEPTKATVVLITTSLVLATALEIDKYPKHDFRKRSRVILGRNCSTGPYIRVLEYNYHPDFRSLHYSALALVQIQPALRQDLIPICAPPTHFVEEDIYAITPTHDCTSKMLRIYKMKYVENEKCREYYRRNDLDIASMWPRHMSCAQGLSKGECFWRSGTVLVNKQKGKWHLLGVGTYGPGCEAPARFLAYDRYVDWVRDSISKIGKVAITRMGKNHIIVRRTMSTLQRYGACDLEERQNNWYSDYTEILPTMPGVSGSIVYNLTMYGRIEYKCIALRAWYTTKQTKTNLTFPELKLRKWCFATTVLCAETSYSTIWFHVIITFSQQLQYKMSFFGAPIRSVEAKRVLWWTNQRKTRPTMAKFPLTWQNLVRGWYDPDPYPHAESNAYPWYPPRGLK